MKTSLILTLLLTFLINTAHAAREPLDSIAAVVDDHIILNSVFQAELQRVKTRLSSQGTRLPPDKLLRRQVLEHLILKEIQLLSAARKGIHVDDTFLNDRINDIAASNGISVAQLKQQVELDGTPYEQYRAILKEEIIMQQLRQRVVYERITVSEQEIDDYLAQNPVGSEGQEYKLKHLLVGVPEKASPDDIQNAQNKAETLYQQLRDGADFSALATAHSSGQRALNGGDIGWFKRPQVPTIFAKSVSQLQKGQVSRPIRSPSGFHIIQLVDKRGEERRLIQQAKVRHILIKPDVVTNMDQARKKIAQLRHRITQGEDFAELARAHSADGSAAQGGDLGWASPNQYVPSFQRTVDKLPLNTLSEPVRTQFGWHILEVLERRDYDETEEYRRNLARRSLHELKAHEEGELWLRRIRDQAYVEFRLPDIEQDSEE